MFNLSLGIVGEMGCLVLSALICFGLLLGIANSGNPIKNLQIFIIVKIIKHIFTYIYFKIYYDISDTIPEQLKYSQAKGSSVLLILITSLLLVFIRFNNNLVFQILSNLKTEHLHFHKWGMNVFR